MSLKANITDTNTGESAQVSIAEGLHVHMDPYPPATQAQPVTLLRSFLTNSAGSSDMAVDGSSTAATFKVGASTTPTNGTTRDRYVKQLHFALADGSMSNDIFAGIGILTNGVKIEYTSARLGTTTIVDAIKTNAEFIRIARHYPFVDGSNGYVLGAVTAAPTKDSAYYLVIDFAEQFGLPYGLRLPYGEDANVSVIVQDDLSGASQFDCIALGFERILPQETVRY